MNNDTESEKPILPISEATPCVYVLADTRLWSMDSEGAEGVPATDLSRYLRSIGVWDWTTDAESDGAKLIEVAGRLCYKSFAPGLNANVKKVRQGNARYLRNLISSGHGSVMEHVSITFLFQDVSRVFTHELVRHRAGVAISQESMRYVRLDELMMYLPSVIRDNPRVLSAAAQLVQRMEEFQRFAAAEYGLDDSADFAYKKHVTSALRRFAPIGVATNIVWTANLRALRHVIEMRTSKAAEEEIRLVFDQVADIARTMYPTVFQDYERNADGEWIPRVRKC